MKKLKTLLTITAIGVAFVGLFKALQALKDIFDNYSEGELFDDDLDIMDDDFSEEPEGPIKEEKASKGSKTRRGYIPIKFHAKEVISD